MSRLVLALVVLAVPIPAAAQGASWWPELGGSATGGGLSGLGDGISYPDLALAPDGTPHVAYSASSGSLYCCRYRRWTGTAWEGLGGSDAGTGLGRGIDVKVVVGTDGNPVVAYAGVLSSGYLAIFVKRWDGTSWVGYGGSDAAAVIAGPTDNPDEPSLALDASGYPVVAYQLFDWGAVSREIRVARWDGSAWVGMAGSNGTGGISANAGNSMRPDLALDPAGNPVVAWYDSTPGQNEIYLKRWDGTAWIEVAGSAGAGGISATASSSMYPSIAIAPDGSITAAWYELGSAPGTAHVLARRWSGGGWAELAGSGTGGGISGPLGLYTALVPSVAIGPGDGPVIAFHGFVSTASTADVYLLRWTGIGWSGLGGSATGSGISGGPNTSGFPSMAMDPMRRPAVAWAEAGTPGAIHLRRYRTPDPVGADQLTSTSLLPIPLGGVVSQPGVRLTATVFGSDSTGSARLEIEAKPDTMPFDGTGVLASPDSASGLPAYVDLLAEEGASKWRYRAVDDLGLASDWVSFGGNPETEADFVHQPSGPGPGGAPSGGGSKKEYKTGCSAGAGTTLPGWIALLAGISALQARRSRARR